MAETEKTRPPLVEDEELARRFDDLADAPVSRGEVANVSQTIIMAQSREVTARKVAVPRSHAMILAQIKMLCASFGDIYVYSWPVKNRDGTKDVVEGGTIKLANDLLQTYGNCSVDCDISNTETHMLFKAWFVDLEKGTASSRLFKQRLSQNIGMKDKERGEDIIFQIGQSKAIRNVVLNALSSYATFAIEEAKKNLIERFNDPKNAKIAHTFIDKVMEENAIPLERVENDVGRKRPDWLVRDLARVYMTMRGIKEGLTGADDVYPADGGKGEEKKPEPKKTESKKASVKGDAPADKTDEGTSSGTEQEKKAEAPALLDWIDADGAVEQLEQMVFDAKLCEALSGTDRAVLDGLWERNSGRIASLPENRAVFLRDAYDKWAPPKVAESEQPADPKPAPIKAAARPSLWR